MCPSQTGNSALDHAARSSRGRAGNCGRRWNPAYQAGSFVKCIFLVLVGFPSLWWDKKAPVSICHRSWEGNFYEPLGAIPPQLGQVNGPTRKGTRITTTPMTKTNPSILSPSRLLSCARFKQ